MKRSSAHSPRRLGCLMSIPSSFIRVPNTHKWADTCPPIVLAFDFCILIWFCGGRATNATRQISCLLLLSQIHLPICATFRNFIVFTECRRVEELRYIHRNPVKRGRRNPMSGHEAVFDGMLSASAGRFCVTEQRLAELKMRAGRTSRRKLSRYPPFENRKGWKNESRLASRIYPPPHTGRAHLQSCQK